MIDSRRLLPIGLLMTGALALAQTPAIAPAAPAPPAPAALAQTPQPARAPRAFDYFDQDQVDRAREMAQEARDQAQVMRDQVQAARDDAQAARDLQRQYQWATPAPAPMPMYELARPYVASGFGAGWGAGGGMSYAFNTPMAMAQNITIGGRRIQGDDRLYESGLRALDSHRWDEALEAFNQVAARAGTRADGGWYWKAYTLNKLSRSDEALAAIAELRKSYASSRWLDEAKALEIEVKQKKGTPVSPESESDEELKLMALNGIMQSDPDRAVPLVENILKGPSSPKLKQRALYVLAQSNQPKAQQVIEQIARGGGNPDLQVRAIEYLGQRRRQSNNSQNQLLQEIYNSTSDLNVKRSILSAFRNSKDYERLGQIARSEKNPDLRMETFNPLGDVVGQPDLWQIYQSETSPDMKIAILRVMQRNGNADKLVEVVKTEKDAKVRRAAIDVLATQENGAADHLVTVYSSEQDAQLKRAIVDSLSNPRNAKYLVQMARAEKDPQLKIKIVDRLSNMHSKEASDYLLEILSK